MGTYCETTKPIHLDDGKFIGWLYKEYKDTISTINFYGPKDKPRITRGWRKISIKEFQVKL